MRAAGADAQAFLARAAERLRSAPPGALEPH